jgi:dTDP-4-dehydrorhamnose 3,5-epimerase
VDLRSTSPTFGKNCSVEIDGDRPTWLWIPPGFAHGFSVLSAEGADVWYKVDVPYNPRGEGGIRFDDPDLAIDWLIKKPILSDRDRGLQTLASYLKEAKF